MDLSLAKLQHLATVAAAGSFSRAAVELGISQPALSRSIAALEERYGVKIFDRGRLGVTLTPAGGELLDEVNGLLRNVRDLDENLTLYGRGRAGSVSFGLSPQMGSLLLTPIALELFRDMPRIKVKATVRSAPDLMDALISGRIEFFLCLDSQLDDHPEVETTRIGASSPIFAVRGSHPLTRFDRVCIADLERFPFVSALDLDKRKQPELQTAGLICDNYHIMRDVVMRSDFVFACMREFVVSELAAGILTELVVSDRILSARPVYVAKRKNRTLSELARQVVDQAVKSFETRTDRPASASRQTYSGQLPSV